MIPDKSRTLNEGAIAVSGWASSGDAKSFTHSLLVALSETYGFSMDAPYRDLPDEAKDVIMNGTRGRRITIHYTVREQEGVHLPILSKDLFANVEERYKYTGSEEMRI